MSSIFRTLFLALIFYSAFSNAIHTPRDHIRNVASVPSIHPAKTTEMTYLSNNELKSRAIPKSLNFTLDSTPGCVYSVFILIQKYSGPDGPLNSSSLEFSVSDPGGLRECAVGPWATPFSHAVLEKSETELNRTVISRDCFCKLPTPFKSFWELCSSDALLDAEDWFDKTCPERKKEFATLDFKGVPGCAKDCLHQKIMEVDCVSERRDCFCFWGELFGCELGCSNKDAETVKNWKNTTCKGIKAVFSEGTRRSESRARLHRDVKPFAWYEIFTITVISISLAVLVVFIIFEGLINEP
ncbi:hypothetical protein EDC01DRAFT_261640 [Geopyxis carbonaria]|nr:hypothetical protein EDC01DRAFT_261640 [Geopyxis carbonaria]